MVLQKNLKSSVDKRRVCGGQILASFPDLQHHPVFDLLTICKTVSESLGDFTKRIDANVYLGRQSGEKPKITYPYRGQAVVVPMASIIQAAVVPMASIIQAAVVPMTSIVQAAVVPMASIIQRFYYICTFCMRSFSSSARVSLFSTAASFATSFSSSTEG